MQLIIGTLVALAILILGAVALSIYGYRTSSRWVGVHNKTFWDWLSILIVPVLLTLGGILFTAYQSIRQQDIEDQRAKTQQQIEDRRAQDAALQAYLDHMTKLLLEEDLRNSQPAGSTSALARARTLTVLRRLDGEGRGSVIQFLYESGLITGVEDDQETPSAGEAARLEQEVEDYIKFEQFAEEYEEIQKKFQIGGYGECSTPGLESSATNTEQQPSREDRAKLEEYRKKVAELEERLSLDSVQKPPIGLDRPGTTIVEPVVNLSHANLAHAKMPDVWLRGADLQAVDLRNADLSRSTLDATNLSEAELDKANLEEAQVRGADMFMAKLSGARLRRTDLRATDLQEGNLTHANLSHAYLFSTDFTFATLSDADLSHAVLTDADLSCANLSNTNLSDADLSAIGPPGYEFPKGQESMNLPDGQVANPSSGRAAKTQDDEILGIGDPSGTGTDLSGADLSGANLSGADLSSADLENAKITEEQLARCTSLEGATMPDGQKYEEWRKDREGHREDKKNIGSS